MAARIAARTLRPVAQYPLRSVQLIETVETPAPYRVVLIPGPAFRGTVLTSEEVMSAKVRWAHEAGYQVLTRSVPVAFSPYNAIIRVTGTEDRQRDYLAQIIEDA